jgi:Ser/Thr protein kinase RdoA (MazF antagonist)
VPLELDFVESLVRQQFGIRARAERLTGERDENFRIQVDDGPGYILKVAPAGESATTADLLPAVLTHLERVAGELPVPRVIRTRDNRTQLRFNETSGAARTATLCTFLPGKLLISSARCRAQRQRCGELLARVARALRTFEHAASRREVAWDIAQVPKLASLIPRVHDLPSLPFLREYVARFTVEIAPRLAQVRHQFVHNDFNARNIIVDPDDEARVAGIIDFGDAVHTALVADVAVGATGQLATPETAHEAIREFAAAYCAVEPLRAEELALLGPLIAGRIVQNVVLTAWHRAQQPSGGHFDGFDSSFFEWRIELAKRLVSPSSMERGYVRSCLIHR